MIKERKKGSGIYVRTEANRVALSRAKLGCKYPNRKKAPPMTRETRDKMSAARKGNKYALGSKHTEEWRQKMREFMLNRKNVVIRRPRGSDHWKWIEDRSLIKEDRRHAYDVKCQQWARQVKNRDYWKCQIANESCHGRMEAHHILSWRYHPELRYQLNNGITLCRFHHPFKERDEKAMAPLFTELVQAKV
jgi:hypothetical protein